MMILVKKLTEDSQIPTKAHQDDAGFDIYSNQNAILNSRERRLISTGISMAIPSGYYGRIAPRSGLAVKNGIDVLAGVVDSGFRNEIKVVLINLGDAPFGINKGDRIAQIIIEKADKFDMVESNDLDLDTDRSMGGFGSTGK